MLYDYTTFVTKQACTHRYRLTHAHVHGLLHTIFDKDAPVEIVGIAESNRELAERFAKDYGYDMKIVFDNINDMIEQTKPEGVMAFNSIYQHLSTVEACAPKGIHVMVEKPLAVNNEHAERMTDLARKHNIQLLTNYETTWYASNHSVYDIVNSQRSTADIRKVIVCDGIAGPVAIGCNN